MSMKPNKTELLGIGIRLLSIFTKNTPFMDHQYIELIPRVKIEKNIT